MFNSGTTPSGSDIKLATSSEWKSSRVPFTASRSRADDDADVQTSNFVRADNHCDAYRNVSSRHRSRRITSPFLHDPQRMKTPCQKEQASNAWNSDQTTNTTGRTKFTTPPNRR